jgi:hypothetical protein
MHFNTKNYLKSNRYYTVKYTLLGFISAEMALIV